MTRLLPTFKPDESTVVVIGLGHVGLPVALGFAGAGFTVVGVEADYPTLGSLCIGQLPHSQNEPGLQKLLTRAHKAAAGKDSSTGPLFLAAPREEGTMLWRRNLKNVAFIIAVDVPRHENHIEYGSLKEAAGTVRHLLEYRLDNILDNIPLPLVVIASTLPPGTTRGIVLPILRGSSAPPPGLPPPSIGEQTEMLLAACPERVTEGRMLWNLAMLPRVIGGITPRSAVAASRLYQALGVAPSNIHLTDATTAELAKCAENAYRDVQLAFANEVALLCQEVGVDVWEARDLINTCPGRAMLRPGPGVGGHCIPKDTHLLIAPVKSLTFQTYFLQQARNRNASMPWFAARFIERLVKPDTRGPTATGSYPAVVLLGTASRADASDDRNSVTYALARKLREAGFVVHTHDPHVYGPYAFPQLSTWEALEKVVHGVDALVLMVDHTEYWRNLATILHYGEYMRAKRFIDLRGCFAHPLTRQLFKSMGWEYHAFGDGKEDQDAPFRE